MQDCNKQEILKHLQFSYLMQFLKIKVYPSNMVFTIYHEETKPSLQFYPETNKYFCHSTKQYGNIIDFFMIYCQVPYDVAIQELRDILAKQDLDIQRTSFKQEIKLPDIGKLKIGEDRLFKKYYRFARREKSCSQTKAKIFAIKHIIRNRQENLKKVSKYIYKYCYQYGFSKEGLQYLKNVRKLKMETIEKFKIIEILDPFSLAEVLKKHYPLEKLIQSGIFNDKGNFIFCFHKILIPYLKNGNITYLRGREFPIGKSSIGKYLGASGFTIKRIFNEDVLKILKPGSELYLCEGCFDTILASQSGYNAIGFPGVNGIPYDKLKKINLYQYKLYNAFDADEAGDKAAQELCNELGVKMIRKRPKGGKDLTEVYHG